MSAVNFFQFMAIKTLDPDWIRIRIGIQPKMLDPDQMNADPQSATLLPETIYFLFDEEQDPDPS